MKIHNFIFDLDGTLLNTISDIATSMNKILENYNFSTFNDDDYKLFVGKGTKNLVNEVIPNHYEGERRTYLIDSILEEYNSTYAMHWADKTKPYEGIVEFLRLLNQSNKNIIVLSNKDDIFVKQMTKHFFNDISFLEICGNIENFGHKPDPALTMHLIEKHCLDNTQTIMIGDSGIDIKLAHNAHIKSCGVMWGFRTKVELEAEQPDLLISSINELKQLL